MSKIFTISDKLLTQELTGIFGDYFSTLIDEKKQKDDFKNLLYYEKIKEIDNLLLEHFKIMSIILQLEDGGKLAKDLKAKVNKLLEEREGLKKED